MTLEEHRAFEELAVGYALHALEPEDELAFEAHLPSCARCERDIADHRESLLQLAQLAPPADPPPALLDGLRSAVAAEPRRPPAPLPLSPLRSVSAPAPRRRSAAGLRRGPVLVAAAAVAAVVLGLGGWNAVLQRDRDALEARGDTFARAVDTLERADTRTVQLRDDTGEVRVVAVLDDEEMSLVVKGLPPTTSDTVYVVWGQTPSGAVRAVGTFDVESSEIDVREGLRLQDADGLARLMVTREEGRTPPLTTDKPILVSGSV